MSKMIEQIKQDLCKFLLGIQAIQEEKIKQLENELNEIALKNSLIETDNKIDSKISCQISSSQNTEDYRCNENNNIQNFNPIQNAQQDLYPDVINSNKTRRSQSSDNFRNNGIFQQHEDLNSNSQNSYYGDINKNIRRGFFIGNRTHDNNFMARNLPQITDSEGAENLPAQN